MIKKEEIFITTSDGVNLHCLRWYGDFDPEAIIHISHGMMEYIERYDDFANFLVNHGYFVYAHSHRGHGKTVSNVEEVGIVDNGVDFKRNILDLKEVNDYIKSQNKDKPVYLLGHSFGSFLSIGFAIEFSHLINGLILSGTSGRMILSSFFGYFLSILFKIFRSGKKRGKFLTHLIFSSYNAEFRPNRTKADWLCSNEKEVDKYLTDPYCGKICSINFFINLFSLFLFIYNKNNLKRIRKDLPILIIKGEKDPVGKNLSSLLKEFVDNGHNSIDIRIYENFRHECLNEIHKEKVYNDILKWLEDRL